MVKSGRSRAPSLLSLLAFVGLAAGTACRAEPTSIEPPSQQASTDQTLSTGAASSSCTEAKVRELALKYCRYTQAGIPLWPVFEAVHPILRPDERVLATELAKEADAAFQPSERPRAWAMARFLSAKSECKVVAIKSHDELVAVALEQRVPVIREPSARLPLRSSMDDEQSTKVWLAGFEAAFDAQFSELVFPLRLSEVDTTCFVDAQLEARFARPLRLARAMDAVDAAIAQRAWNQAAALWPEACTEGGDAHRCEQAQQRILEAQLRISTMAPAMQALKVTAFALKGLVVSEQRTLPYLELDLEYSGQTPLAALWLSAIDESGREQLCAVQVDAPPAPSQKLQLAAASRARGYCLLREQPLGKLRLIPSELAPL